MISVFVEILMSDMVARFNWTFSDITALYDLPFDALIGRALQVKQKNWPDGKIQKSQLLSIKTGGCAENCGYCSQSAHFDTGLKAEKLMALGDVVDVARSAKENGADRFCMGAAWRSLKDRDLPKIAEMVSEVKKLGLETCVTAGMLEDGQAEALKDAGLDYYNHNLDTSRDYYSTVVSTRTYEDRLDTLSKARKAGIKLCTGGILGMGEGRTDRIGLIHELSKLEPHPESVPINMLVPIEGTPLGRSEPVSVIEMARAIAVCRIVFPKSWVRLSAGRDDMSKEGQALCLLAGANSIFVGDRLLTTDNPEVSEDAALLDVMGLEAAGHAEMEAGPKPGRTTLIGS